MKDTLNAAPLRILLERACIGGEIDECLLTVTGNEGKIIALQTGQSVAVSACEELSGLKKGEYGLSQVNTLVKFLGSCKDSDLNYSISDDKKWLHLNHKGHGKLSVVLLEKDMVGTRMEQPRSFAKEASKYPVMLKLRKTFVDDALRYIGLIPSQTIVFRAKKGRVYLASNVNVEMQKFELPIGEIKGDDNISVSVYSDILSKVLSVVHVEKKSRIFLRSKSPVMIVQNPENIWAVSDIK